MTEATDGFKPPPEDPKSGKFEQFIKKEFKSVYAVNSDSLRAAVADGKDVRRVRFAEGDGKRPFEEAFSADLRGISSDLENPKADDALISWGVPVAGYSLADANVFEISASGIVVYSDQATQERVTCSYGSDGTLNGVGVRGSNNGYYQRFGLINGEYEFSNENDRVVPRDIPDNWKATYYKTGDNVSVEYEGGFAGNIKKVSFPKQIDLNALKDLIPQALMDNPAQTGFESDQQLENALQGKSMMDLIGAQVELYPQDQI